MVRALQVKLIAGPIEADTIFFGLKPAALQVLHFIQSTSQALRAALFQRLNLLFLYDLCSGASRFIGEVHHTTTFGLELAGNCREQWVRVGKV